MEIWEYLRRERGETFASSYLEELRVSIESLEHNAHRFRERPELDPGRRALVVKPYLVFYQVRGKTAFIQRILHGARNITPELFEERD